MEPQTWRLKATHIYYFTVPGLSSLTWVSQSQVKVLAGLVAPAGCGESPLPVSPVSRGAGSPGLCPVVKPAGAPSSLGLCCCPHICSSGPPASLTGTLRITWVPLRESRMTCPSKILNLITRARSFCKATVSALGIRTWTSVGHHSAHRTSASFSLY